MATLLLIDDSLAHRTEIRRAVEEEHIFDTILEAGDGFEGLKLLLGKPVDVVLCDLEMPGFDGEKLLQVKESRLQGREIPFLFLTATTDRDRKVRLLQSGAYDTISKPFHTPDLVARLKLHLKIKLLSDELREKNEMLSHVSTTDAVTGLRSRRYLTEILAIETLRANRYNTALSVLIADLDHFKKVNDTYGHASGDLVLADTAAVIKRNLRATDVAGRWGGEEFVVVLRETDLAGAEKLAERWRADMQAAPFHSTDGKPIALTISIGVAGFGGAYSTPEDLLSAADAALYKAKEQGRNCVVVDRH